MMRNQLPSKYLLAPKNAWIPSSAGSIIAGKKCRQATKQAFSAFKLCYSEIDANQVSN